jgi:hypothetical protein
MVAPKRKKSVKDGQGSKKPTFYAQKTVEVMDKKPVFEVFRRFGDEPETLVCKLYPDNLTNPTKFYDTDARLVYDFNSDLIREVPGMAVNAVKQKITELYGPPPQASPQSPKLATAQATPAAKVPEQYKKPPRHVPQPPSPPFRAAPLGMPACTVNGGIVGHCSSRSSSGGGSGGSSSCGGSGGVRLL